MTSRHLGNRIHDLLDGRLSRAETVAAMAHLDDCADCTSQRDALLRDREKLQTSGQGIDMSFTAHLLDRDRIAEIARDEPRRHRKAAQGPGRNVARIGVVAGAGVVAALGGLYVLGAPDTARLEYASTTSVKGDSYAYMTASGMRSGDVLKSWIHPNWDDTGLVPVDARLVLTDDGTHVLEATMLAGLDSVFVTEQHGQLPGNIGAMYPAAETEERDAYVITTTPAQIVFESGNAVVSMACNCPVRVLEGVADGFPDNDDPGVFEQIGDGFAELAGAVSGR